MKLINRFLHLVGAHDVAVDLRLSVLKAKHASWIVEIFNKFQSEKGVAKIKNGFMQTFPIGKACLEFDQRSLTLFTKVFFSGL